MPHTLTPQLHAIFAALVEEACGLHYSFEERSIFEAKLSAQAAEVGFSSLLDYYYRLRYDDPSGEELRALIQALVVHETYFFRELPSLRVLVDDHLTGVIERHGRARIWSAACSTGEEPLTVAMLLDARGLIDKCDIVATDISEAALARAREGLHSARAVREGAPHELVTRYLDVRDRRVSSPKPLRDRIEFRRVNLLDTAAVRALGTFDLVLIRNVLIYFRDAAIARILEAMTTVLAPGGLVSVGVSESLLRFGTALVCEERGGSFVYKVAG